MCDGALLSFRWQSNLCIQLFLHLLNCLYLDQQILSLLIFRFSPSSHCSCVSYPWSVASFRHPGAMAWGPPQAVVCSNMISHGLQEDSLSHHALPDRMLWCLEHLLPLFCPDPHVCRTVSCFFLTSHSLNTSSLRCHSLRCGAQSRPVVGGLEINGTFLCVCPAQVSPRSFSHLHPIKIRGNQYSYKRKLKNKTFEGIRKEFTISHQDEKFKTRPIQVVGSLAHSSSL